MQMLARRKPESYNIDCTAIDFNLSYLQVPFCNRMLLHAQSLTIQHPETRQATVFTGRELLPSCTVYSSMASLPFSIIERNAKVLAQLKLCQDWLKADNMIAAPLPEDFQAALTAARMDASVDV